MKKRNTGKVIGVRWDYYGWKFERTIWEDETGREFIVVNGQEFDLYDDVIPGCDDYYIVRV